MNNWWFVFFQALTMVGIAEMGDKTQFVVIAMTKKYKVSKIVTGILISTLLNNLIAVLFGSMIARLVPPTLIQIISGLLFLFFALSSIKDSGEESGEVKSKFGPILAVGVTFFLAEFGDKTQLSTANLAAAANDNFLVLGILLGATVGMMLANLIGLFVGVKLGSSIPNYIFKWLSVVIFAIFAFITLYEPSITMFGETKGIITLIGAVIISLLIGYIIYKGEKRYESNNNSTGKR